jgi:hypothetical protein
MSDLMLDVGLANELKLAFRRHGFTSEEVKRLTEGDTLGQFRQVLLGGAAIVPVEQPVIDLDREPKCPNGLKLASHTKGGQFTWDPSKFKLHLDPGQMGKKWMRGHDLKQRLADLPLQKWNATMLDFLLANPERIAEIEKATDENWKIDEHGNTRYIFFWNSEFSVSDGDRCIRCLYWYGDSWQSSYGWLDDNWNSQGPTAVCAS